MAEDLTQEHIERAENLAASRRAEQQPVAKSGALEQVAEKLNFSKKLGEHWLIIAAAVLFDLVALIPLVSVVVNACFGLVLFMYFGPKSKGGELTKIALPIAVGSVIDSVFSILPVNIAAAVLRIALD
ncbi:MAG: hypothetical protein HZA25_03485 [Candidatus Niyogibacteria bacterium]|nr:hypothetical protein [Candidatus Niyogibacteria bacterium]